MISSLPNVKPDADEVLRSPATLDIEPFMSSALALRTILGEKLIQIHANIEPTLAGNPEGLHRLRIALRGARAALQLFAPIFAPTKLQSFDRDLQQVCRICGIGRDWDVFCLETLPAASSGLAPSGFTRLVEAAQARRTEALSAVIAEIQGPAFASLLDRLAALVRDKRTLPRRYRHGTLAGAISSYSPAITMSGARQLG